MTEALLGFGANLGDPCSAIAAALDRVAESGVRIVARSSFYRTAPWGVADQPNFINLCARVESALSARELLALGLRIEAELGRVRDKRWGPRLIDIDLLAYGVAEIREPGLCVPHPRLTERAFVLVPLAEIAPDWIIAGRRIGDWAAGSGSDGITRMA